MCRYISAECLCELCAETLVLNHSQEQSQQPPFSAQISEVLAVVLENEDDLDSQLIALHILQDLLSKNGPAFDEQFARLGVPNKILLLAKDRPSDGSENEFGRDETDAEGAVAVDEDQPPETKEETVEESVGRIDTPAGGSTESKEGLFVAEKKKRCVFKSFYHTISVNSHNSNSSYSLIV